MTFTISNGKIAMMEVIADPRRLAQLTIESTERRHLVFQPTGSNQNISSRGRLAM